MVNETETVFQGPRGKGVREGRVKLGGVVIRVGEGRINGEDTGYQLGE